MAVFPLMTHSYSAIFTTASVKLFDPKTGSKYLVRQVLMSNLEMIAVSYCLAEPALHGRERELRDQNHRLWLRPPQAARQSAPEDSLLHAAVRRARDPEIRRLR